MTMNRWSRRRFLGKTGQLAGACVFGAGLDGLFSPPPRAAGMPRRSLGTLELDDPVLESMLGEFVRDLEKKALYASAFVEQRGGLEARAEQGEKSLDFDRERRGVVFQAYDGLRFREASTDRLDPDALRDLVRGLKGDLAAPPRGAAGPNPGPTLRREVATPFQIDPSTIPPAQWLDFSSELAGQILACDSRIRMANAGCNHRWRRTLFVNRARTIHQTIHTVGVGVFAFALDKGKPAPAFLQDRGVGGFERVVFGPDRVEELAGIVDDLLRSERIPAGEYEVVTSPAVTGLLAHESFGHGVEYDQFIKGRAKAAHFLGKRVAPGIVNISDDPTRAGANGSYYFDDEGWEAGPTAIVEDGIFRRPITDLFSSFSGDVRRTGNGRRESYGNKAYARMSNTFFGPGSTPVEALVGTLEDGIYLDGFQSGIEDPHGWGIQLTCNRGYEIRKGRRTGRVFSPIGVTGYVPDILASITHVGDDFVLVPGSCGKGHKEFVPVAAGGPHMRFTAPLG